MRAWQVQSHGEPADVLVQVELEEPKPGPGQVAIRVTAATRGGGIWVVSAAAGRSAQRSHSAGAGHVPRQSGAHGAGSGYWTDQPVPLSEALDETRGGGERRGVSAWTH